MARVTTISLRTSFASLGAGPSAIPASLSTHRMLSSRNGMIFSTTSPMPNTSLKLASPIFSNGTVWDTLRCLAGGPSSHQTIESVGNTSTNALNS